MLHFTLGVGTLDIKEIRYVRLCSKNGSHVMLHVTLGVGTLDI